jgi:transposase
MENAVSDAGRRLQAIHPSDGTLLELLETRDRRLYALVSAVTRYRSILEEQVRLLRAGKDPSIVRGALSRWQNILQDIKEIASDLEGMGPRTGR